MAERRGVRSGAQRRVTLRDVAAACGVTPATVSRILNGTPGFSAGDDIRAAVKGAAERLGYRPDGLARALVQGQTGVVAILGMWPWVIDAVTVYHHMVRAAVERVQGAGFHASANFPHPVHGNFPVTPFRADGALLITPIEPQDTVEVEAAGIPYVAIDGVCGPAGGSVTVDDVAAGRDAAKRLLAAGHRRIACRMPLAYRHHSVQDRLAGIRSVIASFTLSEQGDPTAWLEAVVAAGTTAVICYQSQDAAAVRAAALARGLRVPGDLAIIAFNDDRFAQEAGLTVMAMPAWELGDQAARLLVGAMADGNRPQRLSLAANLVERASV